MRNVSVTQAVDERLLKEILRVSKLDRNTKKNAFFKSKKSYFARQNVNSLYWRHRYVNNSCLFCGISFSLHYRTTPSFSRAFQRDVSHCTCLLALQN